MDSRSVSTLEQIGILLFGTASYFYPINQCVLTSRLYLREYLVKLIPVYSLVVTIHVSAGTFLILYLDSRGPPTWLNLRPQYDHKNTILTKYPNFTSSAQIMPLVLQKHFKFIIWSSKWGDDIWICEHFLVAFLLQLLPSWQHSSRIERFWG